MMLDPRERITEGVTRERLKMEAKRSAFPSLFFFGGIVVTLAIVAFLLANISETFGHKTYQVRLAVSDDYGVFEGFDDVRFRGVPAGTITKVERRGSRLVLLAELQEKYGPIYRDARAEIRPITPLNDVYLDIVDPGSPEAGKADADQPLDESQTATSVSVPEVLDALGPDERVGVYRLLDQLGNGMDDGGVRLRRAFALLAPFLEEAGDLARQVAAREHATKRLIHNTAVLTTELGRREEDLKRLVETGAATLGTLHDGSADLDATFRELGPTFSELRASLASVRVVLADVDRGVTSLYPVAERLPQGLSSVRALNATLGPAVRNLRPAVRRLVPLARALRPASRNLAGSFTALLPQVPTITRVFKALTDCEKGVIGFFQWNSSLSKFGDKNAAIPRGNLAFGAGPSGLPDEPLREGEKNCVPGAPIRNVAKEEDFH